MKYFKAPSFHLQSLNLNTYGSYKQQKFTIKSLKILNFKALHEFHFLSIDFDLQDLLKLLNASAPHLTSLSFTITDKHITQIDQLTNVKLEDACKNLKCIHIEFRTNPSDTFFVQLLESCVNLRRLEIRWPREEHRNHRVYSFSIDQYRNSFQHLKELILGENIRLLSQDDNENNLNLLKRLDYFSINVDFRLYSIANDNREKEQRHSYYHSLVERAQRVSLVRVGGGDEDEKRLLIRVRTKYAFLQRLGVFRLAEDDEDYFYRNSCFRKTFYDKLYKLEFVNTRLNVVTLMDSFDVINLNGAKHLVELDLGHVHIHLTKSNVGEDLANLKCEKSVYYFLN